jgi:hypothetical protein
MCDPLGIVLERFELVKVIEFEKKIGGHGVISQFFPGQCPARCASKMDCPAGTNLMPAPPTRTRKNAHRGARAPQCHVRPYHVAACIEVSVRRHRLV